MLAVGVGLFITLSLSAAQSLALVVVLRKSEQTDAFLAAYALYLPTALLAASMRSSLVPLFASSETVDLNRRAMGIVSQTVTIGLLLAGALAVSAPLLGPIVARGLTQEAQRTAAGSLAVLALATYFHFRAASASALLTWSRRYAASSLFYALGSGLAVVVTYFLLHRLGAIGAAFGLATGACFIALAHDVYLRQRGIRIVHAFRWLRGPRGRLVRPLIAGASISVTSTLALDVSLSAVSATPGAITLYSYAYFATSVLLNVSVVPLGLVRLADAVASIETSGIPGSESYFVAVTTRAFSTLAPALLAFAVFGDALLQLVLRPLFSYRDIDALYALIVALGGVAVASVVMYVVGNILLASLRYRTLFGLAVFALGLQLLIVFFGNSGDATAVALRHVAASACSALALLGAVFGLRGLSLLWRALVGTFPSLALSIVFPIVHLAFVQESSLLTPLGAFVAVGLYLGLFGGLRAMRSHSVWPGLVGRRGRG